MKYNAKKGESGARFTSENTDVKLEDLKSSCKSALAEDSETSKNYSKSRRWCTIPKTLSCLLTDHGLTLLNVDEGKEDSKGDGEKLQKTYEASTSNRISDLNLGSGDKGKQLKTKCGEISKKDSTEADFETLFNNLKGGCTKQEADKLTEQPQQ